MIASKLLLRAKQGPSQYFAKTCNHSYRFYSKFSLKAKRSLYEETKKAAAEHGSNHHHGSLDSTQSVQPNFPARTRFAPSPTGLIHLGSLRTALYNYLLAKSTGGSFLLRLEDTDQNRLVQGAEQNIYESLKWAGLQWDEGPEIGGPYGPYIQSQRAEIYAKYANELIENGHAYRCFCSKERLDGLRDSARKLHPPSMASYDRKCSHLTHDESEKLATSGTPFTVRFKAPYKYPEFTDLLHGHLNLQTQTNPSDVRYDDPVLVKSDGLPTYHLANVVDDHLMKITHVIRGEEWLASTPKHVAMYNAFGWEPPAFVHIPLLTTLGNKKLSKRAGDIGVLSLASKGILPEAMINYVALYGWSPHKEGAEVFSLKELEKIFSLDGLTKGNAKVDEKKLGFLNKHFFQKDLTSSQEGFETVFIKVYATIKPVLEKQIGTEVPTDIALDKLVSEEYTSLILDTIKTHVTSVDDYISRTEHLYKLSELGSVEQNAEKPGQFLPADDSAASKYLSQTINKEGNLDTLNRILSDSISLLQLAENTVESIDSAKKFLDSLVSLNENLKKPQILQALRYALAGSLPGIDIPTNLYLLGDDVSASRLKRALGHVSALKI